MTTRRQFLKQANCAAVGTASLASSLFTLKLTAGAAYADTVNDRKALVCLFLLGGNDSFNMLIPNETDPYNEYFTVRGGTPDLENGGGLALPAGGEPGGVLPISTTGQAYSGFGVHPALPYLQERYNTPHSDLAFVANVGTLIEPATVAQYNAGSAQNPVGLFSHSDEQMHWQTVVPQVRGAGPKGWAGRMADCLLQFNLSSTVGMNISVAGNNVLQSGRNSIPYITDLAGVVKLKDYAGSSYANAIDDLLAQPVGDLYRKTLVSSNRSAIDTAEDFDAALAPYDFSADFPTTQTGKKLRNVAEMLAARGAGGLDMNRQVFFASRGGWDHHNEVINAQQVLFTEINDAIAAFWTKIEALGLQNDVVLFSATDFARTLTSNGRGSDHAWGGNAFMLGGAVNGGKIVGSYPELAVGGSQDIGRGRLLPTTSVDEYCAEMASWFGVSPADLSLVLPNCGNFFNPLTDPYPLGILG